MKKLFYLLLCLPLAFAACTENGDEPQPQPTPENNPVLTLTSKDVMEFKAEGGNGIISYSLVNPVEGVELEATCDADWVENLTVGDNIVFVVPANEGDMRTTTVVVTYGNLGFEVTVKQAAKGETPDNTPKFNLTSEPEMEFGQDETMGTITYEIINPINGVNVTAKTNVDWISQVTVQTDKIVFAVAANKGAAREGKITAEYGMLTFEVKVKQVAYVAPDPVITVETADIEVEAAGGAQSIAYTLENAVDGEVVAAVADVEWITNIVAENGTLTFDVAANTESKMRTGKVTLTHGVATAEVVVSQLFDGASSDLDYKRYDFKSIKAETRAADVWNIVTSEQDALLGEMFTRITVQLFEENAMLIPDGTYSVANGGIILNSEYNNGYSEYRYNNSQVESIVDATIVIANDKENSTTTLSCSFQVGNEVFSFDYRGTMDGFMYEEMGDEGITNWDSFKIQSQWDDCKYVVGVSGSVKVEFYLKKLGGQKSDPLAASTYPVGEWESTTTRDYCENGSSKVNGVSIVSGEILVEEDANGYKFTFNVVDNNGTEWKGTYVGPISA